ncbi:MAG TPA: PH domain-containing protein [Methanomicrobiales archaeon]|nr:PH domain-containing protein [Methanomicrobiales archaeon]
MKGTVGTPGPADRPAFPVMRPEPWGFLPRYLMALAPLLVLAVSLVSSAAMSGFVEGFNASLPALVRPMMAGMDEMIQESVILTAPVGIYLTFLIIGWKARITELWAGSGIALGLSSLFGLFMVTLYPDLAISRSLDLLYWIAYLIIPASLAAVLILALWAEEFRRSISYTITAEGIVTRGGTWKQQESVLPLAQIRRVATEQGLLGRRLHIGTVIPLGLASRIQPVAKGEVKDAPTVAKGVSRHPLDCLYGIRDPEKVRALLEELIRLASAIEKEQARAATGGMETG